MALYIVFSGFTLTAMHVEVETCFYDKATSAQKIVAQLDFLFRKLNIRDEVILSKVQMSLQTQQKQDILKDPLYDDEERRILLIAVKNILYDDDAREVLELYLEAMKRFKACANLLEENQDVDVCMCGLAMKDYTPQKHRLKHSRENQEEYQRKNKVSFEQDYAQIKGFEELYNQEKKRATAVHNEEKKKTGAK